MRKKILIFIAALMCGIAAHDVQAQNVVQQGTNLLNVGLGFTNGALPINVSYDYGVVENLFDENSALTVGGMAGLLLGSKTTGLIIGPRVGLHYHFIPELDTYLSLMLGFNSRNSSNNNSSGQFEWGTHLGARYMFTQEIGGFVEFGYGWSFANIGLVYRF